VVASSSSSSSSVAGSLEGMLIVMICGRGSSMKISHSASMSQGQFECLSKILTVSKVEGFVGRMPRSHGLLQGLSKVSRRHGGS